MTKLKSAKHHWWPECVSRHWAGDDGYTGWIKPNGSEKRIPPHQLGLIGNGHHIKLGSLGNPSPWDESFENKFDRADTEFPNVIAWLESLHRKEVKEVATLTDRFIVQPASDNQLAALTECAVSLAVRGPMNREASVAIAEQFRGTLPENERNALIGLNIRSSQRAISDSIGHKAKFAILYSHNKEFIFGDGFFHNLAGLNSTPTTPKLLVPITPLISVLIARPICFREQPKLVTLVVTEEEVAECNTTVQIYSRNSLFYRSQKPFLENEFKQSRHLRYLESDNPIDYLISSLPGIISKPNYLPF